MDLTWLIVIQIKYALLVYRCKCMDLSWLIVLQVNYALLVYRCKCTDLAWKIILKIKYAFQNDCASLASTSAYAVLSVSLYWCQW